MATKKKRHIPEEYKLAAKNIRAVLQNEIGVLDSEQAQITNWMFSFCVANLVAPEEFRAYIDWYVSDVPLSFTIIRGGGKQSFASFLGPYRAGKMGGGDVGQDYIQRQDLRNLELPLRANPYSPYTCEDFPWAVEYFVIRWLEIVGEGYQPTGIEMVRSCGKVAQAVTVDLLLRFTGDIPCRTRAEFDRLCDLFFAVVLTPQFSWALDATPAGTNYIWKNMDKIIRLMHSATHSEFVEV